MSEKQIPVGRIDTGAFSPEVGRILALGEQLKNEGDLRQDLITNPSVIVELALQLGIEATLATIPDIVNLAMGMINGLNFYDTDY